MTKDNPALSQAPTLEDTVIAMMPWSGCVKGIRGGIAVPMVTPDGPRSMLIEIERPPVPSTYVRCYDETALAAYRALSEGLTDQHEVICDRFDVVYHHEDAHSDGSPPWFELPTTMQQRDWPSAILKLARCMECIIWCADTDQGGTCARDAQKRLTEDALSVVLHATLTPEHLESFLHTATERGQDDFGRDRESFDLKGCAGALADWLAQEVATALHPEPSSSFADDMLSTLRETKRGLKVAGA